MANGRDGAVLRHVGRIFGAGTVAGLSDGQLLERYSTRRDPAAFEALLDRHGSMVLAVCRGLLADPNDADDAFQATFLVLARRAGAVRVDSSLGPWLHGVTHRVAARCRADAARRAVRQVSGVESLPAPAIDPDLADLRRALHEEVARLPAKYRAPIVLCYLQGHTHDQAAAELRWPVGTVRGRLARARDLLRPRLVRRGLAPSAGLFAACLPRASARAAVPEALARATLSASTGAVPGALRLALAGAAPAAVTSLSDGVLRSMILAKLKVALVVALVVGTAAVGARVAANPPRPAGLQLAQTPTTAEKNATGPPTPTDAAPAIGSPPATPAAEKTVAAPAPPGEAPPPLPEANAPTMPPRALENPKDGIPTDRFLDQTRREIDARIAGLEVREQKLKKLRDDLNEQLTREHPAIDRLQRMRGSLQAAAPMPTLREEPPSPMIALPLPPGTPGLDVRVFPPPTPADISSTTPAPLPTPTSPNRKPVYAPGPVGPPATVPIPSAVPMPTPVPAPVTPATLPPTGVVIDQEPDFSTQPVAIAILPPPRMPESRLPLSPRDDTPPAIPPPTPRAPDSGRDRRLDELEGKLDRLMKLVERPQIGPSATGGRQDGMIVRAYDVADLVAAMKTRVIESQPGATVTSRRKVDMEPLIDLLTASVAPGTWIPSDPRAASDPERRGTTRDGRAMGTITPFFPNISLIVRHTPEVHEQFTDRLRQLRRLLGSEVDRAQSPVLPLLPEPGSPFDPDPAPALPRATRPQADPGPNRSGPRPGDEPAAGPGDEPPHEPEAVESGEPKLKLSLAGPDRRITNTVATYRITVENPGVASARRVRASAFLPLGVRLYVPKGASFDPGKRQLSWPALPQVSPGDKVHLDLKVLMGGVGRYQFDFEARADNSPAIKVSQATHVTAFADVSFDVLERARVLNIGEETEFEIRARNTGSKDATKLLISAKISDNLEFVGTSGTDRPAERDPKDPTTLLFPTIDRLPPKGDFPLSIKVKATKPGVANCKVSLMHDDLGNVPMSRDVPVTILEPHPLSAIGSRY